MKQYKHPKTGELFLCLHCKIEQTIDLHHWVGPISEGCKNRLILKDLLNVLFDFLLTHNIFKR